MSTLRDAPDKPSSPAPSQYNQSLRGTLSTSRRPSASVGRQSDDGGNRAFKCTGTSLPTKETSSTPLFALTRKLTSPKSLKKLKQRKNSSRQQTISCDTKRRLPFHPEKIKNSVINFYLLSITRLII